ncbi:hypothetical protein B5X24_HaOG214942 [Helicoverpa armigera]|uniref:Uncharacterized protein n=1 Tax=Helicoverpa armigera TaxID=29058 RepID=A0A2W1BBQ3_HELAM|nr:hypothetical protein B5X24_HaOG214942 [Helicoverpa armigera]
MDASREDLIKGAHTPGRVTMASSSLRAEGYARRAAARHASLASPACAAPAVRPSPACSAWLAMMMTTEHLRLNW